MTATTTPTSLLPKATRWQIDTDHTSVDYAIRHVFSTFRGSIRGVEGVIEWNPAQPDASRIEARIDLRGIQTGLAARDAHLQSADFFDTANHPHATFASRRIEPAGDGRFRVEGALTVRGATRSVTLDVELLAEGSDPWGGRRAGAVARATIRRKDFGLVWNVPMGDGVVLGDEVHLDVSVEAIETP